MIEFEPFPKVPRLNRDIVITEKIDGTNAQILIVEVEEDGPELNQAVATVHNQGTVWALFAGSRKRWVTPGKTTDNHGWAGWVAERVDQLVGLGEGRHFGEFWGPGIGKRYSGLVAEKRFSLFNTARWNADNTPDCVDVVPVIYQGQRLIDDIGIGELDAVDYAMELLRQNGGSFAVPGCDRPEGVMVYHSASNQIFKVTLENDGVPKSLAEAA